MPRPPGKRQGAYLLPHELIRDIKVLAADLRVYPNVVVEGACREYLERHRRDRPREARKPAAVS